MPKSEGNPKSETRDPKPAAQPSHFGARSLGLQISDSSPILLAGVGNELLTDDGIGMHVIRQLEKQPIPGVTLIPIGTDVLRGLPFLEAARRVLLIDAVHGGQPPGTVYVFDSSDCGPRTPRHSLHSMGLREALRMLSPACAPPIMTVIGVEPASLSYGMALSPLVQAALPQVVALARQTVWAWMRDEMTPVPLTARAELKTA